MKTLIKLAFAALVITALYRVGVVYWEHYEFEDSVQKTIQFAQRATPRELTDAVLSLADERGIPLDPEQLTVTRNQRQVTVDATYERSVDVLPRVPHTFEFTLHVSALMLN
jgi:hypothetical protein